ncbi:MAG TPA: hypothetical protein VJP76_07780 [Candidatus Tumulicola sp.]|nr:hypothetical protein [Candidatus Tumulicola sp.]
MLLCMVFAIACTASQAAAASPDLDHWFLNATAILRNNAVATQTSKPDYLGGTTQAAMHCGAEGRNIAGVWELLKYDRRHNIGLAVASTDSCNAALFEAPPPPGISVPDADLTGYRTGRGVHLGMPYDQVRAIYGGKPQHGNHFVVAYTADVPGTTIALPHRSVKLPQTITLVFDGGRVSSIAIQIEEGGLF